MQRVHVARHDLEALGVVPVRPQQRHDLVIAVCEDDVALQIYKVQMLDQVSEGGCA